MTQWRIHGEHLEYPDWDLQTSTEDGWPVYVAGRRDGPRSGVRAGSVAEPRVLLADRILKMVAQAWPRWHIHRLETGWYARRPHGVWINRSQMDTGMAYQMRAHTAAELGELLTWQAHLGEPTPLNRSTRTPIASIHRTSR